MTSVFAVHVVRANDVGATRLITSDQRRAEAEAECWSRSEEVLAAQVTCYVLNQLGTRSPLALFVNGQRQDVPYVSNCRNIQP